jgi:hypothetical protein
MTTTNQSQSVNGTLDVLMAGTLLNSLANAGYAITASGSEVDNRPTSGTIVSYDLMDVVMNFGTAFTAGAGSPNVTLWILQAIDGTHYPTPPGTAAAAAPLGLSISAPLVPSVSTSVINIPNVPVGPYLTRFEIQNNSGTVWPATGITISGLRKSIQNW